MTTADELATRGAELAASKNKSWTNHAIAAAKTICSEKRDGGTITADDVWFKMEKFYGLKRSECPNPAMMGSVFKRLQKDKLVVHEGLFANTNAIVSHGRPIRIWKITQRGGVQ